jgi:N-acetyl-gamma-glutamyl-phosphate reductase
MAEATFAVGLVGARGHVGAELIGLLERHPRLELAFACSRSLAGTAVRKGSGLRFENLAPDEVARRAADAVVLALPNGLAAEYVAAFDQSSAAILDLSADHRFDDGWAYGLPERTRARIRGSQRVANPGCYATAAQLALAPVVAHLAAPPQVFGVSGYSGAGTTPSPRNDPEVLRDNLLAYAPIGHVHEREISRQLDTSVRFMPHVAAFFRGIMLTVSCELTRPQHSDALRERYTAFYADEPLVRVERDAPQVRDAVGDHRVHLGGFACADTRYVVVATIDNLLKGAATQALQNLNLMLGLDELTGIELPADC